MRTLVLSVVLLSLIPFSLYASARPNSGGLPERVAELEAQVEILAAALQETQEILQYVHVETEEIKGVTGPHWIFEGVNVHVRSGSRTTRDACDSLDPGWPNCESLTGLGNLIIGYNEQALVGPPLPREVRTGSHNLVVGVHHSYSSFGGFVAGRRNAVTGWNASVCGGVNNEASGSLSSVSGGVNNEASGSLSSVSGGIKNQASGLSASVSGGRGNVASGARSSVSGGEEREAPDEFNWAAGELFEPN